MPTKDALSERELAAIAKKFREASGKNRAEVARELKIARPTIVRAEEDPERSLTKVRIRIIEAYSPYEVTGPFFRLGKRSG